MPTAKAKTKTSEIYQLKVTLKGSKPPIWRRIQVPGDVTLSELHDVIQVVMGWENSHLHQFLIKDEHYGDPQFGLEDVRNECRTRLNQVVTRVRTKFTYEYDFGDSWQHDLEFEKVLPRDGGVKYPRCVDGARNCPPDDCGGVWGYEDFLAAIHDPKHDDHESMLEWIGGSFDPEAFDVVRVNKLLR